MRRADVWEVWARQAWRTVESTLQVALRALTELSLMTTYSLGPAVQSQWRRPAKVQAKAVVWEERPTRPGVEASHKSTAALVGGVADAGSPLFLPKTCMIFSPALHRNTAQF
ncbi:hypothetical protein L1887_60211 [Cichorium endivia]|nr:hypothetical protein L1887_60211 [Cichorium endivia]